MDDQVFLQNVAHRLGEIRRWAASEGYLLRFPVGDLQVTRAHPLPGPSVPPPTGNICPSCGHSTRPSGGCELCPNCGSTTSCG